MTSYEDLFSRLYYLEQAKHHIEAVIAEKKSPKGTVNTVFAYLRQRGTASTKSAAEEPSHVTMSLSELNSHVNTINLQTEVTNFMHQCAVERGGLGLLRASEGSRLPTLFGNGHVRGEMVVQVNTELGTWNDIFSVADSLCSSQSFRFVCRMTITCSRLETPISLMPLSSCCSLAN